MKWFAIIVTLSVCASACKQRRAAASAQLERRSSGRGEFEWPENLKKEDLGEAVNQYATRVGTCLKIKNPDPGQAQWKSCRRASAGSVHYRLASLKKDDDPGALKSNRDQLCRAVRLNFVDTKYEGGECSQYGNCDEGAWVGYCLAHAAGFTDIKQCQSDDDHKFAILRDKDAVCVLDRWSLEASVGYYRCDKNIAFQHGALVLPDHSLSAAKWYNNIVCLDPLSKGDRPRDTLNASTWGLETKGNCECETQCIFKYASTCLFKDCEIPGIVSSRIEGAQDVRGCDARKFKTELESACKAQPPEGYRFESIVAANCYLRP